MQNLNSAKLLDFELKIFFSNTFLPKTFNVPIKNVVGVVGVQVPGVHGKLGHPGNPRQPVDPVAFLPNLVRPFHLQHVAPGVQIGSFEAERHRDQNRDLRNFQVQTRLHFQRKVLIFYGCSVKVVLTFIMLTYLCCYIF